MNGVNTSGETLLSSRSPKGGGNGLFQGRVRSRAAARPRQPGAGARGQRGARPAPAPPRGGPRRPQLPPPPPSFPTLSLLLHHFLSPPAPLPLTSAPLPLPGRPAAALASPSASSSPSALAHPLGLSAAPCWPRCSRFPWSGAPSPQGSRSGGRPCCLLRPLLQPRHRRCCCCGGTGGEKAGKEGGSAALGSAHALVNHTLVQNFAFAFWLLLRSHVSSGATRAR